MKITEIRSLVLQSFITKNLLDQSIYPKLDLVCALLLQDYSSYNMNSSLVDASYFIKDGDPASATKFNKLQDLTQLDIATLYNFVDYLNEYLENSFTSSLQKMAGIERIAISLNDEINALKLANSSVNQGVQVFGTDFSNLSSIDTDATNASVNIAGRYVSAGEDPVSRLSYFSDIVSSIVSTPTTNGISSIRSYNTDNMVKSAGNSEQCSFKIKTPASFNDSVEIKIDISLKDNLELSRFYMKFFNANQYQLKLYCIVGKSYITLANSQTCKDFFDVNFSKVTTSNIVLYIKTSDNLGLGAEKEFSLSFGDMQAGVTTYLQSSVLQTIPLTANKKFTSVALITDEEIRDKTDIIYSVSCGDNSLWSSFEEIKPINRDGKINLFNVNGVLDSFALIKTGGAIDLLKTHRYIYGNNYCTDFSTVSIENIAVCNYRMLRGLNQVLSITDYNITTAQLYADSDSVSLDFASYPGFLDNIAVSTAITLSKGFHTFRFSTSADVNTYVDYLTTKVNLYFGSNVATYIPVDKFINEIEDNDCSKFTFIEDTDYLALVKGLPNNPTTEEVLMVENNLTAQPDRIMLRANFVSDTNTAILKGFKIKLS